MNDMSREARPLVLKNLPHKIVPRAIHQLLHQLPRTRVTNFIQQYHGTNKWTMQNKIAYLAGLLDGDGTIQVTPAGHLRIRIGMTDRRTITWLYETFGGTIQTSRTPKGRPFYYWVIGQGYGAVYLLLLTIPFLITKRKRAVIALEYMIRLYKQLHFTLHKRCPQQWATGWR